MRTSLLSQVFLLLFGFAGLPAAGNRPLPNVLLLTVDSFRPDRIGCYGAGFARTPNIDRFSRQAILFTAAYSTAAWTNASLVSLLTGLYPGAHGVQRRDQSVAEELTTPLELLEKAGYLVPEINYLFPMPNYRNLGFTPNAHRNVVEFLTEYRDSTFFAWYHFHGPHLPYSPPPKYLQAFLPGEKLSSPALREVMDSIIMPRGERTFSEREKRIVRSLYDAEVAAQDEELGQVFEALDKLGLYENTIVVLTADHGEELFEHGWLGHASTSLKGHLHDELIHIPLVLRLPGYTGVPQRIEALVQSVDLMPTLFDLIGLELDAPVQGRSFRGLLTGEKAVVREDVFCESSACGYQCPDSVEVTWLKCVRERDWKLIQTIEPGSAPAYELYDLANDPGEKEDVLGRYPEEALRLKGVLAARIFAGIQLADRIRKNTGRRPSSGGPAPAEKIVVEYPAEGKTIAYDDHAGQVPARWSGPDQAEYLVEYEVGRGKYYLTGSFPVKGNGQTFGPFNRTFWRILPLYNPWKVRVVPAVRPDLASDWHTFSFE